MTGMMAGGCLRVCMHHRGSSCPCGTPRTMSWHLDRVIEVNRRAQDLPEGPSTRRIRSRKSLGAANAVKVKERTESERARERGVYSKGILEARKRLLEKVNPQCSQAKILAAELG
jgi:hypothetical protein